jgi:TRAP-type C4-dicarboxylate transport system permease small subunit
LRVSGMEQFLERFERILRLLLAGLLAFITIGVFIQVCMRYFFSLSFLWGEELSLFAFIWCVFLGAAIAVRRRVHFSFDFLASLLPGRAAAAQQLLVNLIVLGLAIVMMVQGYEFSILSLRRFSPALGITLFIPTLIIPVSAAYMILAAGRDVVRCSRQIIGKDVS